MRLTELELPKDLPNFEYGDYPVEPTENELQTALIQSRGIASPVVWRQFGFTFSVDASTSSIQLILDEENTLESTVLKATNAAMLVNERITVSWQNWEASVGPLGDIELTLLAGFDIEESIRDAHTIAKHLHQPVEIHSGCCRFTIDINTDLEEAATNLIASTKRLALSYLIDQLPQAIEQGARTLIRWVGQLANHGSEHTDLLELADVVPTLAMAEMDLSDREQQFLTAAITDISAFGLLSPVFISEAEKFYAQEDTVAVEISPTIAVDQELALTDAWREAFLATGASPDYVRFRNGGRDYYTDYTGALVVDIPQDKDFTDAFYLAWCAVAEVERTVIFHWAGRKFTLNPARDIVLFSGAREPLNQIVPFALGCAAESVFQTEKCPGQTKHFILNVRGLQVDVLPDSNAQDLRDWIMNQFCAGPCRSIML